MTNLIQSKKKQPNTIKKRFNTLRGKIKTLQSKLEQRNKDLDLSLHFYQTKLVPAKKMLAGNLTELIKVLYVHYKTPKLLSKQDRKILKEIMIDKGVDVMGLDDPRKIDPELKSILEELEDVQLDKINLEACDDFKNQMSEMFEDLDIDVDLSEIDPSDDRETVMRKVFEAMNKAKENQDDFEETTTFTKAKTKKEIEREKKEKELEVLQKNSTGMIYKQLAKVLHPDLEQNPVLKSQKEDAMKRLTVAYEENDLHELLSIRIEWMGHKETDQNVVDTENEEQLKIYNSILKDQVDDLQMQIDMAHMHPRYMEIGDHFSDNPSTCMFKFNQMLTALHEDNKNFRSLAEKLSSDNSKRVLSAIIDEYRTFSLVNSIWDDVLFD